MKQAYFPWYESPKKIELIESDGIKKVLLNGKTYMSWASWDTASQRMVIAQLYNCQFATQQDLSEVFNLHLNSVQKYVAEFSRDGLEGLITARGGPRQSWKLTADVRAKILIIALKQDILGYEAIQKRLEAWNEFVSIPSIRQVLLENGFVHEKVRVGDIEFEQSSLFESGNERQLGLPFSAHWKLAKSKESKLEVESRVIGNRELKADTAIEVPRALRYYSRAQRRYLGQLEQGYYNTYAGGLLFAPLMEQYAFIPTLKRVIDFATYEGYSFEELCTTLFYLDVFGFRSLEDFKRVYPEEFGLLIGRSTSPSLFTLRRFLHKVRELNKSEELILNKSEELIDEFALMYLNSGIAKWGVLYIDGHFLPYYGIYPITKGWHGVRKIPMKGSYNFIGVDAKFIPWIFLVRSSSEDLLKKIPEMMEKAKRIGRDIGLSEQAIDDLILVFDREGYSAELYKFIDGRDRKDKKRRAIFISWAKYSDKWVNDLVEERFDKSVEVKYEIQGSKKIKYFETKRTMSKFGVIRAIVIQSGRMKKRSVIYTNAEDNEIDCEKIIELLCRRWGEENLIKELLLKHLINYSPGYVFEELEEQPMVDNPQIKRLKKDKAGQATKLHKLKLQLADWILKQSGTAAFEDLKKSKIQLLADIAKADNEILLLNQQIDKIPAKIRFDQLKEGEKLVQLNYEKKRFLDCIKVFVYNMEKKMCRLLLNYYDKQKEVLPALSMIVGRGGHVKLEAGELKVQLRRFMNSEIDYAARHICEDLNRMNPVTQKLIMPLGISVKI
jgi:transposase